MALRVLLVFVFSFSPLLAASYPVGSSDIILHDPARDRDIPLKVYYPKISGHERFPVLVFSHGAGGSRDGYSYLGHYWAAHGYVVLHPTHLGSDRSLLRPEKPFYNLRALGRMIKDKANLLNRPQDITFLLNSLSKLEERVPALKGRMDPTCVGVGGHSFGAYTSMAVAGAAVYPLGGDPLNFVDNRVKAFLVLSPQGPGDWAFKDNSWNPIHRPMFMMTGTQDTGLNNEKPFQWRIKGFGYLRPGHKFLAVIRGANHMDFSDTQFNGKVRDPRIHVWIKKATLLFWDAYVKGKRDLQQRLKAGEYPKVRGVRVRTESK